VKNKLHYRVREVKMTLESQAFMTTMEKPLVFPNENKALLKSNSDWGKEIGSEMADH
jgi:hypothetical protein